jgi:hypothetical protein
MTSAEVVSKSALVQNMEVWVKNAVSNRVCVLVADIVAFVVTDTVAVLVTDVVAFLVTDIVAVLIGDIVAFLITDIVAVLIGDIVLIGSAKETKRKFCRAQSNSSPMDRKREPLDSRVKNPLWNTMEDGGEVHGAEKFNGD